MIFKMFLAGINMARAGQPNARIPSTEFNIIIRLICPKYIRIYFSKCESVLVYANA